MERTITYQISESEHGLRVEQYLRHKGYSYQNLTQLKKMPESILINGIWSYMRSTLSCGDTLTVHIQESEYSEHIPPVQLPLDIIYEDDDLLVVNKPAGMPIHPSLNNYKNSGTSLKISNFLFQPPDTFHFSFFSNFCGFILSLSFSPGT